MCHEDDRIDMEGLAAWLACAMQLAGIVTIRGSFRRSTRVVRRQIRRSGLHGLLDALLFRAFYRLTRGRQDAAWMSAEVTRLKTRFPANLADVPRLTVTDPNTTEVQRFLERLQPDLMVARCKFLLKPAVLSIPRSGTFVLHPGICPEYRNAHGCFWALVRGELTHVGMTLLRADRGVDTGPIYFQASYAFDQTRESHVVIQYRVVLENLDAIACALTAVHRGECAPLDTTGRVSAVWGQPRLSAYCKWRWSLRRNRRDRRRVAAVS